jgi:hypothetical protein
MNSGVYAVERGVANLYTGLLLKQDVMDVSSGSSEHYTKGSLRRMVGGGFLDSLK